MDIDLVCRQDPKLDLPQHLISRRSFWLSSSRYATHAPIRGFRFTPPGRKHGSSLRISYSLQLLSYLNTHTGQSTESINHRFEDESLASNRTNRFYVTSDPVVCEPRWRRRGEMRVTDLLNSSSCLDISYTG
jgi:hypothetical protein